MLISINLALSSQKMVISSHGRVIKLKIEKPNYNVPLYQDIVDGYISLHNARDGGRLKINENLFDKNDAFSNGNLKIPKPIILSCWTEYSPTDETYPIMSLMKDENGDDVNLGEKDAILKEKYEAEQSRKMSEILENIKGNLQNSKILIDFGINNRAEIESDIQ